MKQEGRILSCYRLAGNVWVDGDSNSDDLMNSKTLLVLRQEISFSMKQIKKQTESANNEDVLYAV